MAASAMTETVMPPDMLKGLKPEFVAPLVGVLCAPEVSSTRKCTLISRAPRSAAVSSKSVQALSPKSAGSGQRVGQLAAELTDRCSLEERRVFYAIGCCCKVAASPRLFKGLRIPSEHD